jgi:hypothetical protein
MNTNSNPNHRNDDAAPPEHSQQPPLLAMPLMKTIEDAVALCEKEQNGFYLTAFALQAWVGDLICKAAAEYAEKKNPRDRPMQTGQAWRGFLDLFGRATDREFPQLLCDLFRFLEYEDPMADLLRRSLVPLTAEHEGPSFQHFSFRNFSVFPRERWCDWLDASIHFQTHAHWHLAPVCFDPDPDKRELALLGTIQRRLAGQPDRAKAHWHWHFGEASERFKDSPKWPVLGHAMAAESDKVWPYRQVDNFIISLWPLVKRHNWTYRDLLNVMRPALSRPEAYPCDLEQSFATYCNNVLGLRKTGNGKTANDGRPAGFEVARRLLKLEVWTPDIRAG